MVIPSPERVCMPRSQLKKLTILVLCTAVFASVGCGGSKSLSSPRLYSSSNDSPSDTTSVKSKEKPATSVKEKNENRELLNSVLNSDTESASAKKDEAVSESKTLETTLQKHVKNQNDDIAEIFYNSVDIDDSASAVDDDLWRQFDLAEEYHAMGVVANREAAWEEAQFSFEILG